MKHYLFSLTTVILVLFMTLFSGSPGFSQSPSRPDVESLQQASSGKVEITWNAVTERPSFIRGDFPLDISDGAAKVDLEAAAKSFLTANASLFGLNNISEELKLIKSEQDDLGMDHLTFQQVYQGIDVYGAQMKVHLKDGGNAVYALSNGSSPNIEVADTQADISADSALATAQKALPNGELAAEPHLAIYYKTTSTTTEASLAWFVELRDDQLPARNIYVIDANNGKILEVLNKLYLNGKSSNSIQASEENWGARSSDDPVPQEPVTYMSNPAVVYCREMGFTHRVVDGVEGQYGVCELPDEICGDWDFLNGKCGQEYSYCAKQGYGIRTLTDGSDGFSTEYAVCVDHSGYSINSVSNLSELAEKSAGCGKDLDNIVTETQEPSADLLQELPDTTPPASFDWRTYQSSDWLTPIKNQGSCGSCWAFSAVGVAEAAINVANNNPNLDRNLSEQYITSDCHSLWGYQTCCGGWKNYALYYIRDNGIPDESCMPYEDAIGCTCGSSCNSDCAYRGSGQCSDTTCSDRCSDWSSRLQTISAAGYVGTDRATIKQALVDKGPLAVSMGIGSSYGGHWDGDVYRCTSDSGSNHAVAIVGYDDVGQYWWVRNSWGSYWGDGGYFKLGYGECRIENSVYYAEAEAEAEAAAAAFSATPTTGDAPLEVDFTDQSTGDIDTWAWNFGDGGSSALQNPTHTYSVNGTYTVTLSVSGLGGSDQEQKSAYITVTQPGSPPSAAFSAAPTTGDTPLEVAFSDQSTGEITSWDWSFGDGITSTLQNPSHTYSTSGTYSVSLLVAGPGGSDEEAKTSYISVTEPPPPPTAAFSATPTSGDIPLEVDFTDQSTGEIDTWSWNFGDGSSSASQNPTHSYDEAGAYTVTLTVTGDGGSDQERKASYINATEPVIICSPAETISCGASVQGNNGATGSTDIINSYPCATYWNESGPEYAYQFTAPNSGEVTVSLSNMSADLDIFVLNNQDETCSPGNCIAYGNNQTSFDAGSGETYYLVVDGYYGAVSNYSLNLQCAGVKSRKTYDAQSGYLLPGTLAISEGGSLTGDSDIDNAHSFAGATYDYYSNTFGRNSFDDEGAQLISSANYGQDYLNAYWNGQQTVYGDELPVLDVVAHEWTHAVTEQTANLEYRWQSGALNESFSDIFASMVDREDWLIGEDLPDTILAGQSAMRDMADPTRFGQPAHTNDWVETCSDEEGVHTNNGIVNKAYYLIATEIGKEKAEQIFYRTLTIYLGVTSSLEDARAAALQSATDLYGGSSAEYSAVLEGFNAVGLDGVWQPSPNNCDCAASTTLYDEELNADNPLALDTLITLYRVRSELLTGRAGEHYQDLYDDYTGRINLILLSNEKLRSLGGQILIDHNAGLKQLLNGAEADEIITQEKVNNIIKYLEGLAAEARATGDEDLAQQIETEMERINWDAVVGKSYDEAWEYIEDRFYSQMLFIPMVTR